MAVPKFYFTHLARSPFVLNKFVLTSLVFLDKTYSYQAVSILHTCTHTHTYAYIPAVSGLGNVVCRMYVFRPDRSDWLTAWQNCRNGHFSHLIVFVSFFFLGRIYWQLWHRDIYYKFSYRYAVFLRESPRHTNTHTHTSSEGRANLYGLDLNK